MVASYLELYEEGEVKNIDVVWSVHLAILRYILDKIKIKPTIKLPTLAV